MQCYLDRYSSNALWAEYSEYIIMLTVNLKELSIWCSNFGFLLLFPGYFFYQSAIGLGIIPPFLGGYFGVVSLSVFPLALLSFIYINKTKFVDIDVAFFAIVILTMSIIFINYALGKPRSFSHEMLVWSLGGLLFNLVAYCLASTISIDSRSFKNLTIGSLGLMVLIVFYNIGEHGIFYLKAQLEGAGSESVATYQGFGRSLAVVGLLSVTMLKSTKLRFVVFLVTLFALFYNGARTEFVLFFVAYASLLVFLSTRVLMSSMALILLMTIVTIFVINLDTLAAALPENRMVELLDFNADGSNVARNKLEQSARESIANNPVLGDYGSYTAYAGIGGYSHNLLSAWGNLGLAGFILYIIVILVVMIGIVKVFYKMKPKTTEERMMFVFAVFTILALFTAKDYNYMLFGLMVGFCRRVTLSR
jgi:hypothetical protein